MCIWYTREPSERNKFVKNPSARLLNGSCPSSSYSLAPVENTRDWNVPSLLVWILCFCWKLRQCRYASTTFACACGYSRFVVTRAEGRRGEVRWGKSREKYIVFRLWGNLIIIFLLQGGYDGLFFSLSLSLSLSVLLFVSFLLTLLLYFFHEDYPLM